jgi:predicted house-cleaning noncanonical NTP pyrophosphatase (MazG superfamily)
MTTVLSRKKLVRDRWPEILLSKGCPITFDHLHSKEDNETYLGLKLAEECYEFDHAENDEERIAEIADIWEVLNTIKRFCPSLTHPLTGYAYKILTKYFIGGLADRISEAVREKRKKCGGFDKLFFTVLTVNIPRNA